MVIKLKGKFLPKDYELILFRKMKNLRQKIMIVKKYTDKFYKINISARHIDDTPERVSKYFNGL